MTENLDISRVAVVHMVTGFVMFLALGLLGLTMRLDQAGFWVIDPAIFYQILTLHGAGMVAAALVVAIGGLADVLNRSTPLSARAFWAAYVVNFLAFGFVIIGTLVGGVGAGWTMLYPLPYRSGGAWTVMAAAAVYVGYLLTAISFLIYCLAFFAGTRRAARGVGNALALRYLFSAGRGGADRLPTPSQLAGTVVAIDGIVTAAIGLVWLVPRLLQAVDLIGPMDPLLVKNVIMLFGHMISNLAIYTSAGILFALLPELTGRKLETSFPIVLALDLVLVVLFVPFGHHLYQDFVEPRIFAIVGEFASIASTVPVLLVAIIGGLSMIYRSGAKWSVPLILVALGLWGWTFGGMAGFMDAIIPVNQVTHNTLWVPGHFHTYYLLGTLAFAFAYLYRVVVQRSGARETAVSRIAAWAYGAGGAGFVLMFLVSGALSVPRRYALHIAAWQWPDRVSVGFVILLAAALVWLGLEILLRVKRAWPREPTHE